MWGISYWVSSTVHIYTSRHLVNANTKPQVFPVISGLCWLGMLLGLLISWNVDGRPHYASMGNNQTIAYISDVGAQHLKPLFIAGSCVTTIFLDLAFLSERWLRHNGRLARNTTVTEKVLSGLSMVCALIGTAGLILLSIFDTLRHPTLHDIFLLLFIAGYILSAIFICWEYQRLGIRKSPYVPYLFQLLTKHADFRQHKILRYSFWIKLVFILVTLCLAIAFAACNFVKSYNAAAVLEWAIAFIFTFYVMSFFIDLIPAVHTKNRRFSNAETEMQQEMNDGASNSRVFHGGRDTAESQRTLTDAEAAGVGRVGEPKPVAGRNF